MTFFESACFIASQMFANWLIGYNMAKITAPSSAIIFLAIICFVSLTRGWTETPGTTSFKEYSLSFYAYIFGGKLTCFSQSCLLFNFSLFYIFLKRYTISNLTFLWQSDNLLIIMKILEGQLVQLSYVAI